MSGSDVLGIIGILTITVIFVAILKFIQSIQSGKSDVYNFDRDHKIATSKQSYKSKKTDKEAMIIGRTTNKNVFIENDAKHVFVCGTTGSGKTIALSNFLKSGMDYNYPMLNCRRQRRY